MKISAQLAWTDYLKAQRLHMRPGTLVGILRYVALGFFVLAVIAGGLSQGWLFFMPIIVLIAAIALYFYVFFPRRVRHLFEQHKELAAPTEYEITPEGLTSTSQYGSSNRPWGIFRKWKEDRNLLMLYITDIQFIMIPKRFCTPEQLAALHGYLDQNKVLEASKVKTGSWARTVIWIVLLFAIGIMLYLGFHNPTP